MTGNEAVLGLLLKVTVILGGGMFATLLLRSASAALRHAVLTASLAAAIMLPATTSFLPEWNVPVFGGASLDRPTRSAHDVVAPRPRTAAPTLGALPEDRASTVRTGAGPSERRGTDLPWMTFLLAAWILGILVQLGRAGFDAARMSALVRDAVDDPDGPQAARSQRIASRLGIRRPVRVLFSESLSVPATWGVLRPVVLLPIEAWAWDAERSRIVLLHELAHIRRMDCLFFGLAEAASALWWYHPLMWLCRKRLSMEQEQACDDVVVLAGIPPTKYAVLLVDIARLCVSTRDSAAARAALAMARPSTLQRRVDTILSAGSRAARLSPRIMGLLVAAVLVLVIPIAVIDPWKEAARATDAAGSIEDLEIDDGRVRQATAWSMGARRDREAVVELIARLSDDDARVRGVAALALGKIGDPRAFEPVASLLYDADPRVRELAVLGLAGIGHERRVDVLVPMLRDPDVGVRSVTVSALSDVGDPGAVEALSRTALRDPDTHTRGMAIHGLAMMGEHDRSVVPVLVGLMESEDSRLVPALAKSLAVVGDMRAVRALVERLARESDADARIAIVEALAAFADQPVAVEGLLTAIEDPLWKVRLAAAGAMGGSRDERSVAALLEALRDPVHEVRLQAAWSLDAIEESP